MNPTSDDEPRSFLLGAFRLDLLGRELELNGEAVGVEPTVFNLLIYLVRNRDRACQRDELLQACWPDVQVSSSALDSAVRRLRQVLGDDGTQQEWISTVRGFGYRYIGACENWPRVGTPKAEYSGWGRRVKLVVCDDHAIFREGLKTVLRSTDAEIFDAANAAEALALIAANPDTDAVLLDLEMPVPDGWDALARLRKDHPATPVIVVSANERPQTISRAIEAGASGFIPKSTAPMIFRSALKFVIDGGVYTPPDPLSPSSFGREAKNNKAALDSDAPVLTARQRQILTMVTNGLTNREIAGNIEIAEVTVKSQMTALFRILGVKNRTEAAMYGLQFEKRGL